MDNKTKARGQNTLRTEHCSRLDRLLKVFIQQRDWKNASGVLSVLLKGSARERFPKENRQKYLAAMELLKKMEGDHIRPTKIGYAYGIWISKNGPMKKSPVRDKVSVQLEFILFCLTHGKIDKAKHAAMSLMQDANYESDPVLHMVVGLIYYELWYACIPEEMKLKSSDIYDTPMLSDLSRFGSCDTAESICSSSVDLPYVESAAQGASSSSIRNSQSLCAESVDGMHQEPSSPIIQAQGFYLEDFSETSGLEEADRSDKLMDISILKACGLDASLMPIRLPKSDQNSGDLIHVYMGLLKDDYSMAVKHLRLALYSTPPVLQSLILLVQLLLLGGQLEEALKEVENACRTSKSVLPLRIRATLLECFGTRHSVLLSTCYEDIMNKDPTCSHSLTKLTTMHKNGDYDVAALVEMIALHLDATYASCCVWVDLASCFLKLSIHKEDEISVCGKGNEGVGKRRLNTISVNENFKRSWKIRCRWWLRRHFSQNAHVSELKAGEWEVLSCKAACAAHMYGPEFEYVVSVCGYLKKEQKREETTFLELHLKKSLQISKQLS